MFRCEELSDWQRLANWEEAKDIVVWVPFANERLESFRKVVSSSVQTELVGQKRQRGAK